MIGGLLSLYWDSGTVVAGDDFPLGLENTGRPNVRVRGNQAPARALQPPTPEAEQAVPVTLLVRPQRVSASTGVFPATALARRDRRDASPVTGHGAVFAASASRITLSAIQSGPAVGTPATPQAVATATPWEVLAAEQKKRNLKAMAWAIAMLNED